MEYEVQKKILPSYYIYNGLQAHKTHVSSLPAPDPKVFFFLDGILILPLLVCFLPLSFWSLSILPPSVCASPTPSFFLPTLCSFSLAFSHSPLVCFSLIFSFSVLSSYHYLPLKLYFCLLMHSMFPHARACVCVCANILITKIYMNVAC